MIAHGAASYFVFVVAGLLVAAFAAKWQGNRTGLDASTSAAVRVAALLGAIAGAYLLQLPADLLQWSAPAPPGTNGDAMPMGGRTVLGGLLGGVLAVEVQKKRLCVTTSTGDAFGLPLALALAFGRLGCLFAGCCCGNVCEPAWWSATDAVGTSRVPVQLVESVFHFVAAAVFAVRATRPPPSSRRGRAFATYLAAYGALRLVLEEAREHPRAFGPLTWYQGLAVALVCVGLWLRQRAGRAARVQSDNL